MTPDKKLTVWLSFTPDMQAIVEEVARALREQRYELITVAETAIGGEEVRSYTAAQMQRADAVLAIMGADVMRLSQELPIARVAQRTQLATEIAARVGKRVLVLFHAGVDTEAMDRVYALLKSRGSSAPRVVTFESAAEAVRIVQDEMNQLRAELDAQREKDDYLPPPATPLAALELLTLAWRLAADLQVEPQALLHLQAAQLKRSVDDFAAKNGLADAPAAERARSVLRLLEERQSGQAPTALWTAWMQTAREQAVAAAAAAIVAERNPPITP